MSLKIPYHLSLKVADFPETSPGLKRVTLVLIDGREVHSVTLGRGEEILKIQDRPIHGITDLGFSLFGIKDILPEA